MDIQTKSMPHDLEAEQAVLGSMFFGADAVLETIEVLRSDDFYAPIHRTVYDAMTELFSQNSPIDIITLKAKLEEKSLMETIGGMDYILSLASSMSTWANLKHHIKIVENKSMLRKLIRAAASISSKSYEQSHSVENIIDEAEKEIFSILTSRNTGFVHVRDAMAEAVERLEKLSKNNDKITGLETKFADFDRKTAGLQSGDLIIIAARPSMGKTALALNIAQSVALDKGVPVAVFSLEMNKVQLVNRMLSAHALMDAQKIRTGDLHEDDWEKIVDSIGFISGAPIYIDDSPNVSSAEIRSKCRRLKLEKGLGLVLVDYLQLMSSSGRIESRQQEISQISRNLKALARELNVPVIALSQLSRALESRSDKRPMLSDLRESGAIEQDADVVAFLYRDVYYNPETEYPGAAELIIAKQRNGPTGTVNLTWFAQYTKFEDAEYN